MRTTRLAVVLVLVGALGAGLASAARAATYTVGTSSDLSGSCGKPPGGKCSLRQLIEYEDSLATTPNPVDTVVVPKGTYQLTKGELLITQSLNIVGAGARTTAVSVPEEAIHGRVFDVKAAEGHGAPTVTISGLEIAGGTAYEGNGFFGGDVYNAGDLTLDEDWITGGTASSGGGVSNDTGTLLLERSLVSGNQASTGGGDSGGIQDHGSEGKSATLTVEDSTVAGNQARLGGGIFSWGETDGANVVSIIDSTIADNYVIKEPGGGPRGPGAGLLMSDGTATVAGSILAYNYEINTEEEYVPTNCSTSAPATIGSLGYNLETASDCGFKATGELQDADPDFTSGELQDNGGNTETLAPEPWAPEVDAIPTSFKYCEGSDQRDIARPQGAGCDIGAVELVPYTIEAVEGKPFSGKLPGGQCDMPAPPTIDWGDGQQSEGKLNDSREISGEHTYEEAGIYNGSVTYECDEDNVATYKVPFQARVSDALLSAAGEAFDATAGSKFEGMVATFTDANPNTKVSQYTATITWGDGAVTAGVISVSGKGFAVAGAHTYEAAGLYTTSIAIDHVGGAKATATGSAKVASKIVPFTIEATEGSPFSGGLLTAACHIIGTPAVEWGDGAKSNATVKGEEISGTHTYVEAGTYNGHVDYEDDCGTYKVPFQAKIADAPLTAKGETFHATAGTQFKGTVATFTDANPDGKVSEYTASIEWGDGTSSTAGTVNAAGKGFTVAGAHTYAAPGVYTTKVTIDDVGGAKAIATGSASVAGPPIVSNVSVASVTETSATVDFTIDPDGSETSYVIEYGHTTGYGLSTPPVDIGASDGPQSLSRTLTGLEPGSAYHFDVIASNSLASEGVGGGDQPFSTAAPAPGSGVLGSKESGGSGSSGGSGPVGGGTQPPLPPPVLGKTVNIELVSGKVFISLPDTGHMSLAAPLETAFASLSKGLTFIPLTEARQIPVGSTLEATAGVARITTATATAGKTQSGEFGAGIFKLLQSRKQKGLTELNIVDNRSAKQVCASVGKRAAVAAKLSGKTLGRLNASAHGSFSAHGQYSAATVRGTVWSVANQCDGTLTKVTRGEVSVRDFRRRKTITLFTGQSYLARAPA